MEIKSYNDGLLTNTEVLELLNQRVEQPNIYQIPSADFSNKESVERQVIKYKNIFQRPNYSTNEERNYLKAIKSVLPDVTEAELIQMANLVPKHLVDLYLVIEECAERLNEEQINYILQLHN